MVYIGRCLGCRGEMPPDQRQHCDACNAMLVGRHVKAALLHLSQAEQLAEEAGIDLAVIDRAGADPSPATRYRRARDGIEDLDTWAIDRARTVVGSFEARAATYAHTESWCHRPSGRFPWTTSTEETPEGGVPA